MVETEQLESLESIVSQLGIELRYEKGDFQGGICRIGDKRLMIVNRSLEPPQRIAVIANELAQEDLSGVFIVPAVRKLIEKHDTTQSYQED
ncbi:MAG: hypothetical protein H6695_11905 [Deferribacteres bacterium]|nr:hypothetical protein [candidate division KSB1 bacterium]MCB9510884.1 hypothetical protein [Deferribacteres bacterium]